jgi:pyruvate kinase
MAIETEITLLKCRRTKLVETLGLSSIDEAMIERLIDAEVEVFRLNMSHGDHAGHRTAYERVRRVAEKCGKPTALTA